MSEWQLLADTLEADCTELWLLYVEVWRAKHGRTSSRIQMPGVFFGLFHHVVASILVESKRNFVGQVQVGLNGWEAFLVQEPLCVNVIFEEEKCSACFLAFPTVQSAREVAQFLEEVLPQVHNQ